jgi:MFS family permease
VLALLVLLGLTSLAVSPYAVLMPIFADRILGGGDRGLGILMGASGVGALAGALSLAFKGSVRGLGRWIALSCAGAGATLALFGLSRSFWLSAALLVPLGYGLMVQMASSNTLVQSMVPDRLRGRVMSVYSMMFMGMAPLGALTAGAVAEKLGAPLTVVFGGVAAIGGAVLFGVRLPTLRAEARKLIVAQGLSGGQPPESLSTPPPPHQSSDDK